MKKLVEADILLNQFCQKTKTILGDFRKFWNNNQFETLLTSYITLNQYARIKWDACLPPEKMKVYVDDLAFLRSFHATFLNFNKNLLTKIYLKPEFSLEFVGVKFITVISLSSRKSFGDRKAKIDIFWKIDR